MFSRRSTDVAEQEKGQFRLDKGEKFVFPKRTSEDEIEVPIELLRQWHQFKVECRKQPKPEVCGNSAAAT